MVISTSMPMAVACLEGEGGLQGTVKFYPIPEGTLVMAEVVGLPDNDTGFFGFSICEKDHCAPNEPRFTPLCAPKQWGFGTLPPLLSDNGKAFLAVNTCRFTPCDVLGRTVEIYAQAEDFPAQPGRKNGKKIGCGRIRRL